MSSDKSLDLLPGIELRELRKHRRSKSWLKFKCTNGQQLVIGGFTEPKATRKGFGALLVGYYAGSELRYAGKLRHPRFLGLRQDKAARDVVRELPGCGP